MCEKYVKWFHWLRFYCRLWRENDVMRSITYLATLKLADVCFFFSLVFYYERRLFRSWSIKKNSRKILIAVQWAQLPLNHNFYDEISLFHLNRDEHLWLMFHQSAVTARWLGHKSSSTKTHACDAKTTSQNPFDETKEKLFFSFSSSASPFFSSQPISSVLFRFLWAIIIYFRIISMVHLRSRRPIHRPVCRRCCELACAPRAPFFGPSSVDGGFSASKLKTKVLRATTEHERDCTTHNETRNSAAKPVSRGALSTKRSGSIRMVGSFFHLYWEFSMCGRSAVLAMNGDCNILLARTDDDRNVARSPFVQLSDGMMEFTKNKEEFSLALTRLGALQYRNETRFPFAGHTRAIQIEWKVSFCARTLSLCNVSSIRRH